MIPEIEFRYSYIYDEIYRKSLEITKILKKVNKKYPTPVEVINFADEIDRVWKKEGNIILKSISKFSGIKWDSGKISCYLVGFCKPMSDPLTIKVCNDITHAIDVLTHELIHYLQSKIEDKKWDKWQKYLDKKYSNDSKTTKDHIFLNAVHMAVYFDIFGADRLERDLDNSSVSYHYQRAWQIVQKEGPDKIIKKFKELTR